jgi:hypothetical protein
MRQSPGTQVLPPLLYGESWHAQVCPVGQALSSAQVSYAQPQDSGTP